MLSSASNVTPGTPLIVASVASVQNLNASSPLGNMISEMIRTRLVQDGHEASDMRLRNSVLFKRDEGEFVLSRDRRAIMPPLSAAAIVTGTYAASYERVYVSLKMISPVDAHIVAASDFVVPLRQVEGLLYPPHSS